MIRYFIVFRLYLLVLMFVTIFSAQAQHPILTKVKQPEDMTWDAIAGITQDHQGKIWFATFNGLFSYDGYQLESFNHDSSDSTSLSSGRLESVFVTSNGVLWVGSHFSGLNKFDPITKKFTRYSHDPANPLSISNNTITAIIEDQEGTLWIGTHGGLNRFDQKSGVFYRYQHDPEDSNTLSNDQVRALYEDKQGTIWVGTGSPWPNESPPNAGGLNRLNKEKGTFTRFLHDDTNPFTLIDNKVRAIFEDSQGTFWVGTFGDGLHTMDREKGTFTRHQYDPQNPKKLSRSPLSLDGQYSFVEGISFITEDALGNLWIGTTANGLSRYNPKTGNTEHFNTKSEVQLGMEDNYMWWAHPSKDGVIWFGSLTGDLYRMDPFRRTIAYQPTQSRVWGIYEDKNSILWVGTNKGVKIYDKINFIRQTKLEEPLPEILQNNIIYAMMEDSKGNLWIGTGQGLWKRSATGNKYTNYKHDVNDPTSIGAGNIITLHEDSKGFVWAGSPSGRASGNLNKLDPNSEKFTRLKVESYVADTLSLDVVVGISEDLAGNLWIGTQGSGLKKLDQKSGTFKSYLPKQNIFSLSTDKYGRLWVGSRSEGIFIYDPERDTFTNINHDIPLNSAPKNVHGFVFDNHGSLWASYGGGIAKMDSLGNYLLSYGMETGINPASLNILSSYKGKDNRLYFGDGSGFYHLDVDEIIINPAAPQLTITGFRIFDELVMSNWGKSIESNSGLGEEIILTHDQNVFSFEFLGIHYTNPLQNRFYYKLENYDDSWRQTKTEQVASFYNVPPGNYTFRIKMTSSDGVWTEKSMPVKVLPPWWRTWWAYASYILLFGAAVYSVDRVQRARIIQQEREKSREIQLKHAEEIEKAYKDLKATQTQLIQSEKMASLGELTAGIAHEIQNPLNFVNNFSEVSTELLLELEEELEKGDVFEAKTLSKNLRENLQKITHHGGRADAIVKGMLQHSRSSSGQKVSTDLNSLADEYLRLSYHGLRAKDKTFTANFITDFDPNLPKIDLVAQDLGRVILNLINNAFYAVNEKAKQGIEGFTPEILVSTKKTDEGITLTIKDNGPGIPDSIKEKIFQPFFTTKPTGQGTGLGLSLSYDIVKAHGGDLKVESKEGEGSIFSIHIPINI